MALAIRRRLTPVYYAQQIISAISYIRQQRQIPNFERISRYLQRYADISPRQCKEHLNNAVSDGLIVEYSAIVSKGQRTGLEQEGYRIPQAGEVEQLDDGHDWYCFECHLPGEVYECNSCFRVYHQGCTREDTTGDQFTCSVCRASRKRNKMKKRMLNTLLSYTILHLREKTRELYKLGTKASAEEFKRYVFKKMDLNRMELKVQASRYKCLEEFHSDARTILHNCTLIFGEEKGGITDLAAIMVRDCKYDLDEIELCPNCYYMSNAKPPDWFCQPCNPPHELVYAKQKGYSYWPAKVVRDLGGKSDVRFFGGWHQRAVIPAEYIRPITTDLKAMAIKKTAGFTKAMKELKKYESIFEERERERERNGSQESEEEEEVEEAEDEEPEEEDQEEEEQEDDTISLKKRSSKSDITFEEEMDEEEEKEEEEEPKEFIKSPISKKTAHRRRNSSHGAGKISDKKAQKRSRDFVEDDDVYDRQVSSTSAEKNARKRKKSPFKQHSFEESYTVSSSGDNKTVTNVPVPTSSTSAQTTNLIMEDIAVQTELLMDVVKTDDEYTEFQKSETKSSTQGDKGLNQQAMDDQLWEERMASAMAELTKRLEEKFEEDKAAALLEQSRQLEEDFGKDKQQAVERTIASMKLEVDKAKKAAEDKAREQYMEEMKKLAAKHKEAISQTKKKQW
ncbi:zinc finger MYND domain-containing protein 11, partial [Elysia marginata]